MPCRTSGVGVGASDALCVWRVMGELKGGVQGGCTHVPSRCAGCLEPGIHDLAAAVTLVLIATVCHVHAPLPSISPVRHRAPPSFTVAQVMGGKIEAGGCRWRIARSLATLRTLAGGSECTALVRPKPYGYQAVGVRV
jgi:hypothetical protein